MPVCDKAVIFGRFVGYDSESKGYRIYWTDSRTVGVKPKPKADSPVENAPEPVQVEAIDTPVQRKSEPPTQGRIRKPLQYVRDVLEGKWHEHFGN